MSTSETHADHAEFAANLLKSENQMGFCVVTLLAWLASSDGEVSSGEEERLREIASSGNNGAELKLVVVSAERGEIRTLQLACEVVQELDVERKRLFLQLAVGISLEDGYLKTPEIHVLHFLADLMGLGTDGLNTIFEELTGHPFPAPGDPSSKSWWQERESDSKSEGSRKREGGNKSETKPDRIKALATLGLEEDATADEIKSAYLRLAKVHHPDRFASLGPEAVEAATATFRRIQAAYEFLGSPR